MSYDIHHIEGQIMVLIISSCFNHNWLTFEYYVNWFIVGMIKVQMLIEPLNYILLIIMFIFTPYIDPSILPELSRMPTCGQDEFFVLHDIDYLQLNKLNTVLSLTSLCSSIECWSKTHFLKVILIVQTKTYQTS